MIHEKFAVFILTHGRADRVVTYDTLRRQGYTGEIYIIIDDEDEQAPEYKKRFGQNVIVFSKKEMDGTFDIGDNLQERRVVVYARNKCHEIAKDLGLEYFLELDDDYDYFAFRKEIKGVLTQHVYCKNLNKVFDVMLDFLDNTGALTVAFAQGGDFIGGINSTMWREQLTRKAMNSFFCRTDRPFQFFGRINEDTTMYCVYNTRGEIIFTIADIMLHQELTQQNAGGLTDIYCDMGTYYKSFFSVMFTPSCVKVSRMGNCFMRIHHNVKWNNCAPKIINEKYKKR